MSDDDTRCFRCGKLTSERTDGPSSDEVSQTFRWQHGVLDVSNQKMGCRAAVVCWPCWHEIDPDLWIRPSDWTNLKPVVPYEKLPDFPEELHGSDDVGKFPWPLP